MCSRSSVMPETEHCVLREVNSTRFTERTARAYPGKIVRSTVRSAAGQKIVFTILKPSKLTVFFVSVPRYG